MNAKKDGASAKPSDKDAELSRQYQIYNSAPALVEALQAIHQVAHIASRESSDKAHEAHGQIMAIAEKALRQG